MTKKIELSNGDFALVDDEDYEWLAQWKWHFYGGGYASRKVRELFGPFAILNFDN